MKIKKTSKNKTIIKKTEIIDIAHYKYIFCCSSYDYYNDHALKIKNYNKFSDHSLKIAKSQIMVIKFLNEIKVFK